MADWHFLAAPQPPLQVGSLQINAGQRYDVLVCSRKVSGLSRRPVWIRAGMQDQTTADTFALAVLYFTQQPPTSLPTSQAAYEGPALTIGDVSDAVNPNTLQVRSCGLVERWRHAAVGQLGTSHCCTSTCG
jgi:hypothetical protein